MIRNERILIIDFGSQVTQLIARRIRECGVYAEIVPCTAVTLDALLEARPRGIILSGGPASVYAPDAPRLEFDVRTLAEHHAVPVLGICYGLQLLAYQAGGSVTPAERREYGRAELFIERTDPLFEGVPSPTVVWMSHGDAISQLPQDYEPIARTENAPYAAIRHRRLPLWGLQFHPEVHHTADGARMLENFARRIAGASGTWTPEHIIATTIEQIRHQVGSRGVLCALSGGVDSTVAAVLIHRAIGEQLHCIHVDTGLMRAGESHTIEQLFREHFDIPITVVHAEELFLERLRGVTDPEEKRKIIGHTFIEVFEREAARFPDVAFLAQGTLYPDVIESQSVAGPSATIKTHHNVGGLPETMNLQLVEPFRELFKDEVRAIGRALGVPQWFLERHPFPGPGLAIRIIGEVTHERLELLRKADDIYITELRAAGLYTEIWQAFAVLVPIQTVGVMGDSRTYEHLCVLRAVTSTDGMTADWYPMPHELLGRLANRITSQVRGINRVCYDITSKPPATIEWE
ncbi:MAG: GMP synthase [glutamine-hydrolyzing] [Candidatus Kapaibacterium sp.]|nr:MAG: GMP synthase [glutamine-hydrolyzing] [Candidatus Kapabacteria bacterium]